jgi:hypothetical protein
MLMLETLRTSHQLVKELTGSPDREDWDPSESRIFDNGSYLFRLLVVYTELTKDTQRWDEKMVGGILFYLNAWVVFPLIDLPRTVNRIEKTHQETKKLLEKMRAKTEQYRQL